MSKSYCQSNVISCLTAGDQFIVFSAVVGGGIFFNDGEALEVAGPGGMLLAVGVIGIIACFVMEGISELVQLFPVPNAPVEYVAAFVDQDFGWVIGIAHWSVFETVYPVFLDGH